MGYPQIKGELEENYKELGFEHCIILRPGLLMGARYVPLLSAQQRVTDQLQGRVQRTRMDHSEAVWRDEVNRFAYEAFDD